MIAWGEAFGRAARPPLLVVLSVCVIFANLFMDVLNLILDPRLRAS